LECESPRSIRSEAIFITGLDIPGTRLAPPLRVTPHAELKEAVEKVGNSAGAVENELAG
jgi:hypothetical protein